MSSTTYTRELVQRYLDDLEMLGKTERTVKTYGTQLHWYCDWMDERGIDVTDVGPREAEEFANRPRRSGPPAIDSIRQAIAVLRGFHKHLIDVEEMQVDTLSRSRVPKRRDRDPKPIDDATWLRVWTANLDPQDRLFLGLGYYCGLRRSEIVTVPPYAVNPETGYMWFNRKGGSTNAVEYMQMLRSVRIKMPHLTVLTDEWLEILHETARWRAEKHLPTLYWDVNPDMPHTDPERLNKRLYKLFDSLNLPRLFTLHQLRHSCATNLHRAGVDIAVIANLLSHSSPTITMTYTSTAGSLERWCDEQEGKTPSWATSS